jgi:hypothetical protein
MPVNWRHFLSALPNWGGQTWLTIFSVSFAIITLEGSYRVVRKKALEYWNAEQSLRQDIERLKQALIRPINPDEKRTEKLVHSRS